MSTKYPSPPGDSTQSVVDAVRDVRRETRDLQRPGGTRLASLVAQVQQTLANINSLVISTVNSFLSTGTVSVANLSASGSISASGVVTGTAGMSSIGVYNNLLTSGYRGMWVKTPTGEYGYVPSSRRFKQDEAPAPANLEAALAIQVVTFRYIQAVEELGDAAQVEWGVIAEDLHNLGFTWLVDYDDDGLPFGVKKEAIIFAFIPVIQDHEARLRAAGL